jgi:hypothetical protein
MPESAQLKLREVVPGSEEGSERDRDYAEGEERQPNGKRLNFTKIA